MYWQGSDRAILFKVNALLKAIAELLNGIAKSAPAKQAANHHSLSVLPKLFEGRTLLVGTGFKLYASEKARLRALGRPLDEFDLLDRLHGIVPQPHPCPAQHPPPCAHCYLDAEELDRLAATCRCSSVEV